MVRRAALLLLSLSASCILEDERCGPYQQKFDGDFEGCKCVEGAVATADNRACTPCGQFETAMNNACVCMPGYSKQAGVCTPVVDAGSTDAGIDSGMTATAPTGEGMSCSSSADCASYDAKFCQNLRPPGMCFVQGCATGATTCFGDRVCCDLSPYGVPALVAAGGLCLPPSSCNAPAKVVTP